MHLFLNSLCLTTLLTLSSSAYSLPIGFGRVPGDKNYDELKSKNFYVYHDESTPQEAKAILNALEAARPKLEKWFKQSRTRPLPVIVSAETANASFANFITDAIELQTMGTGGRDLAWHEYVHSTMYRHFDNWLGPAGSILHLMWLPSWFVEGLAEALSVSIGSDQQASIERYYALSKRWPSYDKIHSLYSSADFSFQGYAISGSFVSYVLRQQLAENLPEFLEYYFYKSMPWYWPYSIMPLKTSMPLDNTINHFMNTRGEELYEKYKLAAESYWQKTADGKLHTLDPAAGGDFSYLSSLRTAGNQMFKVKHENGSFYESEVKFKGQWASHSEIVDKLPGDLSSSQRIFNEKLRIYIFQNKTIKGKRSFTLNVEPIESRRLTEILERDGLASNIHISKNHIIWQEHITEMTRICMTARSYGDKGTPVPANAVSCPFRARQPRTLQLIGSRFDQKDSENPFVKDLWLRVTESTLQGDRHSLIKWNPDAKKHRRFKLAQGGYPISITQAGTSTWALVGERSARNLRRIDDDGNCLGIVKLNDLAFSVHGFKDGSIALPLFNGANRPILRLSKNKLKSSRCYIADENTSPLLVAMQSNKDLTLKEAAQKASLWRKPASKERKLVNFKRDSAKPLDKQVSKDQVVDVDSQDSQWRPRPVFGVPWLGADADGYQLGLLSVPLMDHMQNEEARAYLAYGMNSRFPHTEISFKSRRFWPTLSLDVFRYQTWNGRYVKVVKTEAEVREEMERERADDDDPDNDVVSDDDVHADTFHDAAYIDERGARLSSNFFFYNLDMSVDLGIKASMIKPYIGEPTTRKGRLNEPFMNISHVNQFGGTYWTKSLTTRAAPDFMNDAFDYNVVGVSTAIGRSIDFLDSNVLIGADGSRTRGLKRRELQEVYRPLKVFVPGSGSGYNNLYFPLMGCCGLFSARYGDNQGRLNATYSFPIIKNVDKLIRLFYWETLRFTAFANYGGAWDGAIEPDADELIVAHGYNFNAHFDIKGINFHLGQGFGQVLGSGLQTYISASFDAIID